MIKKREKKSSDRLWSANYGQLSKKIIVPDKSNETFSFFRVGNFVKLFFDKSKTLRLGNFKNTLTSMSKIKLEDALKQLKLDLITKDIFSTLPSVMENDSKLGKAVNSNRPKSWRVAFLICIYLTLEGWIPEMWN